ncbi:MAG: hypothetical protein R3B68_03045 [Phycisphaerales bacterium]
MATAIVFGSGEGADVWMGHSCLAQEIFEHVLARCPQPESTAIESGLEMGLLNIDQLPGQSQRARIARDLVVAAELVLTRLRSDRNSEDGIASVEEFVTLVRAYSARTTR